MWAALLCPYRTFVRYRSLMAKIKAKLPSVESPDNTPRTSTSFPSRQHPDGDGDNPDHQGGSCEGVQEQAVGRRRPSVGV